MRFCIAPLLVADEMLVEVWIGEQLEVVSETSVEVDMGESILAASIGTEPWKWGEKINTIFEIKKLVLF